MALRLIPKATGRTRKDGTPIQQARINVGFSPALTRGINKRLKQLGLTPAEYMRYCVTKDIDQETNL